MYGGEYVDATQLGLELNGVNAALNSPSFSPKVEETFGATLPDSEQFSIYASPAPMSAKVVTTSLVAPTRLVAVTAEANDAQLAANLANAFALAFTETRQSRARLNARERIKVIQEQLAEFSRPEMVDAATSELKAATYVALTQELVELKQTARSGGGGYKVVLPAEPPDEPFEPKPIESALIGLGTGICLAIVATVLVQRFGARLDGLRQVAALVGYPILGRVPRPSVARSHDPHHRQAFRGRPHDAGNSSQAAETVVSLTFSAGRAAEAYRRLRASLSTVISDGEAQTLLFTSATEREGTGVVVANIAVALARTRSRVIIVDADLRHPRLHACFALPNDVGVSSLAIGEATYEQALHVVNVLGASTGADSRSAGTACLDVLTTGPAVGDPGDVLAGGRMAAVLAKLKASHDIVLVASSGILSTADTASLAITVDGLILVVDTRLARRRVLGYCRDALELLPSPVLGVVLTEQERGMQALIGDPQPDEGRGPGAVAPSVSIATGAERS